MTMVDGFNKQLGKYQLKEFLGRGSMAEVYKAFQPTLERDVAIKVIHSHLVNDPNFVDRFRYEARVVAALRHPGIVQVYDFEIEGDTFYMVMEFVPGESLQQQLATLHKGGERIPLNKALSLFRLMVQAVAYAHDQGVVHRDLKPANILLTAEGKPILADFGLSTIIGAERLADSGAIIGTPAYMSPEQGEGKPGDERSDIYSLGVLLYELMTGNPPFSDGSPISIILKHLDEPPPPPRSINAGLPAPVEQIIQKALEKHPANRFQSAQELLESLAEIALPQALPDMDITPPDTRCPYRGLQVFEAEHAEFYFGRETLVSQLVEKLRPVGEELLVGKELPAASSRSARFITVLGASGSGKSSLVRAGLVPALQKGAAPGSKSWVVQVMKPGNQPLEEMAARLAPIVTTSVVQLRDELVAHGRALHLAAHRAWSEAPPEQHLLLVVDQFEEIFTLCHDEAERARFIENLLYATAVDEGRVIVVLTMRADFYHRCAAYRDLAGRISARQMLVGPMQESELRRAIEQPARQVGLQFEAGLVDIILADVVRQPGALPLLQYALLELWEGRQGRLLTQPAYQSIGGVAGAIAQRAENIYADFSLEEQTIVRRIMLRLTQLGEGTEDTRRRAKRRELLPGLGEQQINSTEAVLQQLANARLVTTGLDMVSGEELVDVSHEALIRGWARLQGWIDEDRMGLRIHRQLTEAAETWEQNNRDASYLYQGGRLTQAEEWTEAYAGDLNELEQAFLEASRAATEAIEREREAARQHELAQAQTLAKVEAERSEAQVKARRRLQWFTVGLGIMFIAAIGIALWGFNERNQAQEQSYARATEVVVRSAAEANALQAKDEAEQARLEAVLAQSAAQAEADEREKEIFVRSTAQANSVIAQRQAVEARQVTEQQNRISIADRLAAQILPDMNKQPQRSLLLTIEALNVTREHGEPPAHSAEQVLRQVLSNISGQALLGHTDVIHYVAISPDGNWVATGSLDDTARVWNLQDLTAPPLILNHEDDVRAIAFSPDGHWFISGSKDTKIRIWDTQNWAKLPTILEEHKEQINALAISADNQRLATGGNDDIILLWQMNDVAAEPIVLTGHEGDILDLTFSPDSRWLASGAGDTTARVWDMTDLEQAPAVLTGHEEAVYPIAISPDNQWLVTSGTTVNDNIAQVWNLNDLAAGPILLEGHTTQIDSIAFSPDNRWLATGGGWPDSTIGLWDLTALDQDMIKLTGHTTSISNLRFTSDSRRLISASGHDGDNMTRIWDLDDLTKAPVLLVGHDEFTVDMAVTPDDHWLVTVSEDNTARVWDLHNPKKTLSPFVIDIYKDTVGSIAVSPDDKWLVISSFDNTAHLWNPNDITAPPIPLTGHKHPIIHTLISADSRWMGTWNMENTAYLWDLTKNPPTPSLNLDEDGAVYDIALSPDNQWFMALVQEEANQAFYRWRLGEVQLPPTIVKLDLEVKSILDISPDGKWVVAASPDNVLYIWPSADLTAEPIPLSQHQSAIFTAVFSPDSQWLITVGMDKNAYLWRLNDLEAPPFITTGNRAAVSTAAFSSDSRWLATGSWDTTIMVWDLNDLSQAPTVLRGHESGVVNVRFSPDDQQLISVSGDKTVRIWNMQDLKAAPVVLLGHTGIVHGTQMTSDNHWLVSASLDHTARVWNMWLSELLEGACKLAVRNLSVDEWQSAALPESYRLTCSNLPIHPSFMDIGGNLAQTGDQAGAIAHFQRAVELDPNLQIDPQTEAATVLQETVKNLLKEGEELATGGNILVAVAKFEQALQLDPTLDFDPKAKAEELAAN